MTKIYVERLVKRYDKFTAVKGITFEVKSGEFFSLLGPSGCGKTTTLYCISGLERPTEGHILFDDVDVTDLPARKRNIGMVFQSYAVFTNMSVADNLAYPLRLRKIPKHELSRRLNEVADLLGLRDILGVRAGKLNMSQMQLVSLGRAIIYEPRILLLDEPLSNLEPTFRLDTLREIRKIQRLLGMTIIFVTHDQLEAMSASDRIAVMNYGEIMQIGTPSDVYYKPANKFVAGFIGSPPMNFIEAELGSAEGKPLIKIGEVKQQFDESIARELGAEEVGVVLGIRPEDIRVVPAPAPAEGITLRGRLSIVDRTTTETVYSIYVGDTPLKIITDKIYEEAQQVYALLPFDRLYVFSRETGECVRAP